MLKSMWTLGTLMLVGTTSAHAEYKWLPTNSYGGSGCYEIVGEVNKGEVILDKCIGNTPVTFKWKAYGSVGHKCLMMNQGVTMGQVSEDRCVGNTPIKYVWGANHKCLKMNQGVYLGKVPPDRCGVKVIEVARPSEQTSEAQSTR